MAGHAEIKYGQSIRPDPRVDHDDNIHGEIEEEETIAANIRRLEDEPTKE